MLIRCSWCRKILGEKEGEGITDTICPDCFKKVMEEIENDLPKLPIRNKCLVPSQRLNLML